jgi:xanthine dehydrogenase YagT iron-sulfur-binding subunit
MCDEKRTREPSPGVSRRGFLTSAGLGAVGIAATGVGAGAEAPAAPATVGAAERVPVALAINGREHRLLVEPRWSLLHVLREELGMTGAKPGCERGECGACTVLIDDRTRYACLTLAIEAEGRAITTLEGLMAGEELGPVQRAFVETDAYQCGYCTPGQVVAVEGLLRTNSDPTIEEVRVGVSGNLCRCGSYPNIFKAARRAAELTLSPAVGQRKI